MVKYKLPRAKAVISSGFAFGEFVIVQFAYGEIRGALEQS
jgi:hypothetical protein